MRHIPVLYENHACLVLNKPSGLAVQGGEGVGASLDSILTQSYKNRPYLVHRLDKDTSGVIITAKNSAAHEFLSNQFRKKKVLKFLSTTTPSTLSRGVPGLCLEANVSQ